MRSLKGALKEAAKRLPFVGTHVRRVYRRLRYREGRIVGIQGGHLRGFELHSYERSVYPGYVRGDHEQRLQDALVSSLRPGSTFYDVGANGGFFTLLGASRVGPRGRVVAFEPHPETTRQLKSQLRLNAMDNVEVVEAAVAEANGREALADDLGASRLTLARLAAQPPRFVRTVRVVTLDEAAREHGVPDAIKIDIEGAELLALRGATDLLRTARPLLFIELHSAALAVGCGDLLEAHDYQVETLEEHVEAGHFRRLVVAAPREHPHRGSCITPRR